MRSPRTLRTDHSIITHPLSLSISYSVSRLLHSHHILIPLSSHQLQHLQHVGTSFSGQVSRHQRRSLQQPCHPRRCQRGGNCPLRRGPCDPHSYGRCLRLHAQPLDIAIHEGQARLEELLRRFTSYPTIKEAITIVFCSLPC
jgi:hypothetical protein